MDEGVKKEIMYNQIRIQFPLATNRPACYCEGYISYDTLQMNVSEQQTLAVLGEPINGCGPLYTWEIESGGGSLSTDTGLWTVYTAPDTNPGCIYNPTIVLKCRDIEVDSITIAVTTGGEDIAYSVAYMSLITCCRADGSCSPPTGGTRWMQDIITSMRNYRCDGTLIGSVGCHGSYGYCSMCSNTGCNDTDPYPYGVCTGWTCPLIVAEAQSVCSTVYMDGTPFGDPWDRRTEEMINTGCCPEVLL